MQEQAEKPLPKIRFIGERRERRKRERERERKERKRKKERDRVCVYFAMNFHRVR